MGAEVGESGWWGTLLGWVLVPYPGHTFIRVGSGRMKFSSVHAMGVWQKLNNCAKQLLRQLHCNIFQNIYCNSKFLKFKKNFLESCLTNYPSISAKKDFYMALAKDFGCKFPAACYFETLKAPSQRIFSILLQFMPNMLRSEVERSSMRLVDHHPGH